MSEAAKGDVHIGYSWLYVESLHSFFQQYLYMVYGFCHKIVFSFVLQCCGNAWLPMLEKHSNGAAFQRRIVVNLPVKGQT